MLMYYDNVCMCMYYDCVCFITKLMMCINLYSQYPLHPAHLSYDTSGVVGARVMPHQQKMEIDMAILSITVEAEENRWPEL